MHYIGAHDTAVCHAADENSAFARSRRRGVLQGSASELRRVTFSKTCHGVSPGQFGRCTVSNIRQQCISTDLKSYSIQLVFLLCGRLAAWDLSVRLRERGLRHDPAWRSTQTRPVQAV